jgi:hypothetical protein
VDGSFHEGVGEGVQRDQGVAAQDDRRRLELAIAVGVADDHPCLAVSLEHGDEGVRVLFLQAKCGVVARAGGHRLLGSDGGFVVFRGADGFGLTHPLLILDARTGTRVWDAHDAAASPARFRVRGDVVSVEYARVVASDCVDAAACVARAREDAKSGDEPKLTLAPSCAKAEAPLQVAVPVRVEDLRAATARLVSGVVACATTP